MCVFVCFQALSVGIFPYVLKLLQSSARELRPHLVFIWAKILAVDSVSKLRFIETAASNTHTDFLIRHYCKQNFDLNRIATPEFYK